MIRHTLWSIPAIFAIACSAATTQQSKPTSRPSHSLQDQMVRHFLERVSIDLPRVRAGSPIHLGEGKLVLLARGAGGELEFEPLERRTVIAKKLEPELTVPVEEIEEGKAPAPPAKPAPKQARPKTLSFKVRFSKKKPGHLEVHLGKRMLSNGPKLDLAAIRKALEPRPHIVNVEPDPRVPFAQVLRIASEAHAAGLRVGLGGSSAPSTRRTDQSIVDAMPAELGWEPGKNTLYNEEVLMCFGRDEPYGNVAQIMQHFAQLRVWRLGFVGEDEHGHRTKIPVPLAADPGFLK